MIDLFPQSILQAEEVDACAERIVALITEALPTEPVVLPLLPAIARDRAVLQKALTDSRGSAFTRQLEEADNIRDDTFLAFRALCESATRRRLKPAFMAAGDLLMRLIRANGYALQSMGNSYQTGALNALFTALEAEDAVAAIALISAAECLSELEDAQMKFEQVLKSRTDEQAAKTFPQLTKAKSTLGKRLQNLLGVIDMLDAADSTATRPELDELIAQINATMSLIVAPARTRRTRAAAEEDEDASPAPAPTPAPPTA
jgi:hypothetical protein